ncbi:MAG: hypothetical protein V3S55_09930, partial [Nitrospiraceae bacterium]
MGLFGDFKSAIVLGKRFAELLDTFRETQNTLADLGSEVKRLRMEWADHLDYTERAVGRWSKREQLDKKRARDAEDAAPATIDLDQLIRDGSVN